MTPAADYFSPAQIGRALSVSAQAARKWLADTPPTRTEPAAWSLGSLTYPSIVELTVAMQKAEADGWRFRNLAHFVSEAPPVRKPSGFRLAKPSAREEDFAPIVFRLGLTNGKDNPEPSDVALVWREVCLAVEAAAAKSQPKKKFRRALLRMRLSFHA